MSKDEGRDDSADKCENKCFGLHVVLQSNTSFVKYVVTVKDRIQLHEEEWKRKNFPPQLPRL